MDEEEITNPITDPIDDTDITDTPDDEIDTGDDTPPELSEPSEEDIDVDYIKYYVRETKTKVLTDKEFIERRIAEAKGEEVEPIEFVANYSFESLDKIPNIFVQFVKDEWAEEEEIPEGLLLIKTTTKTDVEYSYSEIGEETVEIATDYEYKYEFYFDVYSKKEPEPEKHEFGVCVECKHCMISEYPFHKYLCKLRKRVNNISGKVCYYRCEDFNKYGECLLFEKNEKDNEEINDDVANEEDVTDGDTTNDETAGDDLNDDKTSDDTNDEDITG